MTLSTLSNSPAARFASVRSYYFNQAVFEHFSAVAKYPDWIELRNMFKRAAEMAETHLISEFL